MVIRISPRFLLLSILPSDTGTLVRSGLRHRSHRWGATCKKSIQKTYMNEHSPLLQKVGEKFEYSAEPMTPHDYFMAHAPKEIAPWFKHDMIPHPSGPIEGTLNGGVVEITSQASREWNTENYKQRQIQWPRAWADEMMKQRR